MAKWFGTDGIRGTVGEWPMTPEFLLLLGRAAGKVFRGSAREATIVLGRDTRSSGTMLQAALEAGLLASGMHVIELGVVPTPAVAWLVSHLKADAGGIVSASHNPPKQNGIKFFDPRGFKLPESIELEIENMLEASLVDRASDTPQTPIGRLYQGEDLRELYLRDLLASHPGLDLKGIILVVDCANGSASEFAPRVFSRLGAEVLSVHASPDGKNINIAAGSEHVRRSLDEMVMLIRHHHAHFGLAFDGDADRVVFVDETGHLVDGDHMLGMLSSYLDQRGALLSRTVVTTVMRNSGLKAHLEQNGIRVIETPVGDKYVADQIVRLRESNPSDGRIGIGGEQAGHILIVDDEHPTGDGIRTALFVIRALLESGSESLADFAALVGKTPQIIASVAVGDGLRLSREDLDAKEAETLSISGVIRANLRYSGTEPLFRVMLESDGSLNEENLARIAQEICQLAQRVSNSSQKAIDILNVARGGVIELP